MLDIEFPPPYLFLSNYPARRSCHKSPVSATVLSRVTLDASSRLTSRAKRVYKLNWRGKKSGGNKDT